jgi:hypothetical protein
MSYNAMTASRMHEAFTCHEQRQADGASLAAALAAMCSEAHFRKLSAARAIAAMRQTWEGIARPAALTVEEWLQSYHVALGRCMSRYFEDDCLCGAT